jgi:tripartite-type tricarboxylate transporter receptor subunit TctC
MIRRRSLPMFGAAVLGAPALAQTGAWPSRQIRLVVPYPPGGAADVAGRIQAQLLSDGLGVPVVVDNRVGAGGTLGTAHVAQSAPDGYTVMMASPSSHLGAPMMFRTPGYEGVDDFTPIATLAQSTSILAVTNGLPVRSVPELIAYGRANPGKLAFGSSGAGGNNHMLGVLFMRQAGIEMVHVPYRGGAQALADLISGQIQLVFDPFAGILPTVRAGMIRALAVTSPQRWPLAPEFPTVREGGLPDFDLSSFSAVVGPLGIPEPIVARMNAAMNAGLQKPETVERLAALSLIPFRSTPAELGALFRTQRTAWQELIRSTGLQPE